MAHPYPPHWAAFAHAGRHHYSLTFVTDARRPVFQDAAAVDLVREQILRAALEKRFALTAYCFMPDHLHMIIGGEDDQSDCKAFVKAAKQYSGYYFAQARGRKLWERYGHDRVIRDEQELAMTLRYLVANPVREGLVKLLFHLKAEATRHWLILPPKGGSHEIRRTSRLGLTRSPPARSAAPSRC